MQKGQGYFVGSGPLPVLSGGPGGAHGRHFGAVSVPVHSKRERIAAERNGAKLLFVSPIFSTASHPGARALGRSRFGLLIAGGRVPVIALGGMTRQRARSLSVFKIHGWAAISSLTYQKRKAVPTIVRQRLKPVPLGPVTHACSYIEIAGEAISAANIERNTFSARNRARRIPGRPVCSNLKARAPFPCIVTQRDVSRFASTRQCAAVDSGHVT